MREITTCSRRNFVRGAALGAAGLAAVGLTACAQPAAKDSMADTGDDAAPELTPADETWEADVLVIGLGASGLQAALGAAAQGVGVLAIDQAPDMVGTTNITTSGYLCVGDKLQMAQPYHYEVREVFDKLNEYSNYCFNTQVLKAILDASSRSSNNLIDAGLPVKVVELPERKELTGPTLGQICGHAYDCKGQERADIFQAALDKAGVDSRYGVTAEQLIFNGDEIVGVRCTQDGKAVDVNAKAICLCTGGFLGNEDMVAQYFAGSRVVPMGNPACKGAGINMALSAKGQMGKAFSLSSNEYGGANFDASPMFAFRPDSGSNEALRLVLLGSIIVDSMGNRFVSEEIANKEAMHCAEPFIRAKTYYTVVDQDFIDYVKSKPLGETMGDGRMKKMFADVMIETLDDDLEAAVAEGWVAKGDTIAELAEAYDLPDLESTIEAYNGYCETGVDEQFYNAPEFLHKVATPPFYIVQSFPAGWLTLGGVKCDASCQVVDADNKPVEKLFIAGADADLFCAPYIAGGSANGFAQASGLIAGESAAALAKAS